MGEDLAHSAARAGQNARPYPNAMAASADQTLISLIASAFEVDAPHPHAVGAAADLIQINLIACAY